MQPRWNRAEPQCYHALDEPEVSFAFSFLYRLTATGYRNWPWSQIPEPSQVFPGSAGKSRTHLQAETATPRGGAPPAAKRLSPTPALEPTPVGVLSSAFAVDIIGRAWLSLGRSPA